MGKLTKKDYVEKYKLQDKEWLISELASKTVKMNNLLDKLQDYNNAIKRREREENNRRAIQKVNENMADVLAKNGIRTRMLEVSYVDRDCKHCKHADYSRCMSYGEDPECGAEENWYGEECKYKNIISTIGFYVYTVDNGTLSGITSDFNEREYDVISIKDIRTGETLFEADDETDD